MKKLNLIILIAVVAAGAIFAGDSEYSLTLGAGESTVILPPRYNPNDVDGFWTTNSVVTNGYVFRVQSTKENYMVLTGGTTSATNYPSGTSGQVETSGTATVIHCRYKGPRVIAHVTQEADANLWYQTGYTATTNGGEFAYLKGQQYRTDERGAVSVYSESAVKINIWDK